MWVGEPQPIIIMERSSGRESGGRDWAWVKEVGGGGDGG